MLSKIIKHSLSIILAFYHHNFFSIFSKSTPNPSLFLSFAHNNKISKQRISHLRYIISDQASQVISPTKTLSKTIQRISRVLGSKTEGLVINYQTIESNTNKSFSGFKYENILSNSNFIRFQSILIILYAILVIVRISFEVETQVYTNELDILELVFVSFFVLEVFLKISTYRLVTLT